MQLFSLNVSKNSFQVVISQIVLLNLTVQSSTTLEILKYHLKFIAAALIQYPREFTRVQKKNI